MKSKKIELQATIKETAFQTSIAILINGEMSKEIIMLLVLLKERLVDRIELLLSNITIYLSVNEDKVYSVCSHIDVGKKKFKGSISDNMLEFSIYYLLKYYRDEIGEVEHIDLDFEYDHDRVVTLTIKVDSFKEISADEMNKALGL